MIYDIERLHRRLSRGRVVRSEPMQLVHARVEDVPVVFCVTNAKDAIQKKHWMGQFYEKVELMALRNVFPEGGTFLDIGANIGNHTLFAALIWKASQVVSIEPNPLAYNLLFHNVIANGLRDVVDLRHIGVGLSDREMGGFAMQKRKRNLGAAKMLPGQGELTVVRGDVLLAGLAPDLIKIDVEGMEMQVLSGLEGLLTQHRPMLLVEVDDENARSFKAWCDTHRYACAATIKRYRNNKNHLMVAQEDLSRVKAAFCGTALADPELENAENRI